MAKTTHKHQNGRWSSSNRPQSFREWLAGRNASVKPRKAIPQPATSNTEDTKAVNNPNIFPNVKAPEPKDGGARRTICSVSVEPTVTVKIAIPRPTEAVLTINAPAAEIRQAIVLAGTSSSCCSRVYCSVNSLGMNYESREKKIQRIEAQGSKMVRERRDTAGLAGCDCYCCFEDKQTTENAIHEGRLLGDAEKINMEKIKQRTMSVGSVSTQYSAFSSPLPSENGKDFGGRVTCDGHAVHCLSGQAPLPHNAQVSLWPGPQFHRKTYDQHYPNLAPTGIQTPKVDGNKQRHHFVRKATDTTKQRSSSGNPGIQIDPPNLQSHCPAASASFGNVSRPIAIHRGVAYSPWYSIPESTWCSGGSELSATAPYGSPRMTDMLAHSNRSSVNKNLIPANTWYEPSEGDHSMFWGHEQEYSAGYHDEHQVPRHVRVFNGVENASNHPRARTDLATAQSSFDKGTGDPNLGRWAPATVKW